MAKNTCSIDGCEKKVDARGWCSMHYTRFRSTGSLERRCPTCRVEIDGPARRDYCSAECKPRCAVDGCDKPSRKRQWCEKHYQRWRESGSVDDSARRWVIGKRGDCHICGESVPEGIGFRRYCSRSCAVLASRVGNRPRIATCRACGAEYSLLERGPANRRRYSSKSVCDACSGRKSLRPLVPALAGRDGTDCALCGDPVNIALPHPDPECPSVDHVIPRSHGGADDMSNYALTHLRCNVRKNNRLN